MRTRAPRRVWRGLWLTAQRNMSRSLAIADLSSYANLAQAYVNQQCRLRWQDWVVPPSFVYTCYGGTKEMQICKGLDDFFTCTLGTCIRLSDRPDWPIDWWAGGIGVWVCTCDGSACTEPGRHAVVEW